MKKKGKKVLVRICVLKGEGAYRHEIIAIPKKASIAALMEFADAMVEAGTTCRIEIDFKG